MVPHLTRLSAVSWHVTIYFTLTYSQGRCVWAFMFDVHVALELRKPETFAVRDVCSLHLQILTKLKEHTAVLADTELRIAKYNATYSVGEHARDIYASKQSISKLSCQRTQNHAGAF